MEKGTSGWATSWCKSRFAIYFKTKDKVTKVRTGAPVDSANCKTVTTQVQKAYICQKR